MQKTPWGKFKSNSRSYPYWNSTRGGEKGDGAYRRRNSSGEVSKEVGEVIAVTSRYGSALEMAGVGQSSCVGKRVRRRWVIRPAHGGMVQSVGSESFTKWRRGGLHEELENGAVTYPVHDRLWAEEVRRGWFGFSV
jgi:hypothetical protein